MKSWTKTAVVEMESKDGVKEISVRSYTPW